MARILDDAAANMRPDTMTHQGGHDSPHFAFYYEGQQDRAVMPRSFAENDLLDPRHGTSSVMRVMWHRGSALDRMTAVVCLQSGWRYRATADSYCSFLKHIVCTVLPNIRK